MSNGSPPGAGRTVCILGGTGFVGSRLATHLASLGYRLRVPTRRATPPPELRVLPTLRAVTADVHDPAALRECVAGCDAVVNCIGILNERGTDGSGFQRAHVELMDKLLDAIHDAGVDKLVQISALNADAARGPSHYLRTKGQAEELIHRRADGLRWTIVQPSVIFGPGDSFLNRFATLVKLFPVMPLACPDARFAPVHVADVVEALSRALSDSRTDGRTYQLCGPQEYALQEIVRLIARTLSRPCMIVPLPDPVSRLQGRVMERLPGKIFTTDNYRSMTVSSVCTEDGLAALGIEPRSMELFVEEALMPGGQRGAA